MARSSRITKRIAVLLLCLAPAYGWTQQDDEPQQMRGLDEQVQEIKSDVLGIAEELIRTYFHPYVYLDLALLEARGLDAAEVAAAVAAELEKLDGVSAAVSSYDLAAGRVPDAGWRYLRVFPEYQAIGGWYAFYPGAVECFVGDERVLPQPGGFYGGWVTDDLAGPIKGEPGSGAW